MNFSYERSFDIFLLTHTTRDLSRGGAITSIRDDRLCPMSPSPIEVQVDPLLPREKKILFDVEPAVY